MVDLIAVRKAVWVSWGFTLMGVFNILIFLILAGFIGVRFIGPAAVAAIIMPTIALSVMLLLVSEVIISFIFQAEVPHPVRDARFIASLKRVSKGARFWIAPRGRIISLQGKPNAMAFGPPVWGLAVVAASRELVDMLTDDELDGVLAHECAHVRCRDIAILAVIGIVRGLIDKLGNALKASRALILQNPVAAGAAWILYGVSRVVFFLSQFAVSQEREFAADALGAKYSGKPAALISALEKLHAELRKGKETEEKPFLHDLMIAHPGLERRIDALKQLIATEGAVA